MLIQLIVESATNGTYFVVPFSGTCNIQLLGYQYHSTNNASNLVIEIRSDILRFNNSQTPHFSFLNNYSSSANIDNSTDGFHIRGVQLNGQIQLAVVARSTGAVPVGFTALVLNLDVEEISTVLAPRALIGNGLM
jgi:hypothetical protein